MRLICLSDNPNKPCYILKFKGVTLMLDCGLDLSPTLNFLPLPLVHSRKLSNLSAYNPPDHNLNGELKECNGSVFVDSTPEFGIPDSGAFDFADVDGILISNYTCMLALPYVTEETGFKGVVYMTEPTLHIGRLFMEETIEYIERTTKSRNATKWKSIASLLPPPLCDLSNPAAWKHIYTKEKMESSLSKIQLMGYSEKKDIFGLLTVSPVSSGYCLGSSNWIISSGFEKIAYVSGTSTLTTHPRPMDQAPLRNVNCLILTAFTQTPTHKPDPMIGEFCKTVVETTRLGGNVLVPCYPSGITYDLFECLAGQMEMNGINTPMFFVSPVADSSLAYSNIMAEWLSQGKQNRVYLPEEPFPHGNLSRSGRLKSFTTLHDENFSNEYRQPCIMFCGHPSLRFGDAIHFIELWGSNPNNTIVFTEPSFPFQEALAPFQPLHMKVINCPIDTSLDFTQAKKLIRELKPGMIAVPESYSLPPPSAPGRMDLTLETDIPKYNFARYDNIKLPVKSKFEQIQVDPNLAAKLLPVEIRPGVAIATISGNLNVVNNKFTLKEIDSSTDHRLPRKRKISEIPGISIPLGLRRPSHYVYGKLNINEFIQKLTAVGISKPTVGEKSQNSSCIIHLENEGCLIQVNENETNILCDEDSDHGTGGRDREMLRKRIRDVLISCLHTF